MFYTTLLLTVIMMKTATSTDDWILHGRGSCDSSIFFESASTVGDCQAQCETVFCDLILWFDDDLECYISSSSSCVLSGSGGQIWEHAAEPTSAPTGSAESTDWKMISAIVLGVLLLAMLGIIYLQRHRLCPKSEVVEMTEKEIMLAAKDPLFISLRDASLEEHYQTLILGGWKLDALLNLKNGTPLEKSCGLDSYTASTIYLRVLLPLAQEIEDMASEILSSRQTLPTDSRSPTQTGRYIHLRDGKQPIKEPSFNRRRGMEVDIELAKIGKPQKYTRRMPPMPVLSESNDSDEGASMDGLYNQPGHTNVPHMHTPQNPNDLTPQIPQEHFEGHIQRYHEQGEDPGERFTVRAKALPELPDLRESTFSEMEGKEGEKKLVSSTSRREHEGNVRRFSNQSTASIV